MSEGPQPPALLHPTHDETATYGWKNLLRYVGGTAEDDVEFSLRHFAWMVKCLLYKRNHTHSQHKATTHNTQRQCRSNEKRYHVDAMTLPVAHANGGGVAAISGTELIGTTVGLRLHATPRRVECGRAAWRWWMLDAQVSAEVQPTYMHWCRSTNLKRTNAHQKHNAPSFRCEASIGPPKVAWEGKINM